jgi:hypothetical protein
MENNERFFVEKKKSFLHSGIINNIQAYFHGKSKYLIGRVFEKAFYYTIGGDPISPNLPISPKNLRNFTIFRFILASADNVERANIAKFA